MHAEFFIRNLEQLRVLPYLLCIGMMRLEGRCDGETVRSVLKGSTNVYPPKTLLEHLPVLKNGSKVHQM